MSRATEFEVQTPGGRFAGLAWPNPGAPRVMCLHGWLDNAASFLPMAPFLREFDLVAMDFAGHGHSDHRPAGVRYHMTDNLWDLEAVLDEMGWKRCHLVGHSLGGVVASTYAAAAPGRVERLVTLDGLGSLSAEPGQTTSRLRESLQSIRKATGRLRDYPDIETAARARGKASGLPFEAAMLICERSMSWHGDAWRWRTDPSLNWRSPTLMTEGQVLDILRHIESPTLSVFCRQLSSWLDPKAVKMRMSAVSDCVFREIDGHHHFHMDQPELTAGLIIDFLNTGDAPSASET